ncbi:NAD(P)H-binding protein [Amycolatopsis sp. NPDC059657]|uniref:NAD(P)H-binding protein n=1 Tax=Amycolatopsis sp. NPDC059657 TaxID=3346899 RepID=UPI00366C193F
MIVVAGATGNVGREVARLLIDAGAQVRALTRDPATATVPAGAEAAAGDLTDPSSLAPALAGAEALFLLSGYAPEIFAEAGKAGVRRVVLMSGGSAETGDRTNAVARYMIDTEDALRASGLAWTMIRPRMFMTNAFQWLPQLEAGVVRAPWPDVPSAVIDPADIAAVAAKALLSEEHEGREYPVTGSEALRPGDRVRILGEVLGRGIRYEAQPDDEARAEMLTQMPEEFVEAFFSFYSDGKLDEATVFWTVEEVTGRPPRTFADWVRANAERFR